MLNSAILHAICRFPGEINRIKLKLKQKTKSSHTYIDTRTSAFLQYRLPSTSWAESPQRDSEFGSYMGIVLTKLMVSCINFGDILLVTVGQCLSESLSEFNLDFNHFFDCI